MALEDYKQAIELNPEDSDYYFKMAYCYQLLDQYENSLSAYLQYIEKFGEDSGIYNNMGIIYQNFIQDYVKALECYDKAIELSPEEALYHANKAELFYSELNDLKNYLIFQDIAIEKVKKVLVLII